MSLASWRRHPAWRTALLLLALLVVLPIPTTAHGGGTHIGSADVGPYHLIVSSTPSPRVGTVDLSLVVRAPDAGAHTEVRILASPVDRSYVHREYEAVREAGSPNRYHASVAFPTAGSWYLTVRVSGPAGTRDIHLDVVVSRTILGATPTELVEFSFPVTALFAVLLYARFKRSPESAGEEGEPSETD